MNLNRSHVYYSLLSIIYIVIYDESIYFETILSQLIIFKTYNVIKIKEHTFLKRRFQLNVVLSILC